MTTPTNEVILFLCEAEALALIYQVFDPEIMAPSASAISEETDQEEPY